MIKINYGNKKAQNSQDALLNALLKLMESEDFNQITISQIAGQADVSRPTFYRNFKDKEDVLKLKINQIIDSYINQHKQIQELSVDSIAPILFETIIKNQRFFQLLVENRLLYLFMEPLYLKLLETHRSIRADLWSDYDVEAIENFFSITFGACEYFIRLYINEDNPKIDDWTNEFIRAIKLLVKFTN